MPIYEYSCAKCGSVVEAMQKFSDKPLRTHKGCGGKLSKLISRAAFQLKGTGWYVTDYARKGQSGSDGAESGTPKGKSSDAKTDGGSEKPAASTAEKPRKTESAKST